MVVEIVSRRWPTMAVGGVLGCLVAFMALSPAFIAGGGKWLRPDDDLNAYLVAWNYFVNDAWRFPVFDIPAMGYPEGGSVLLNDALPLTALATKAIYSLSGARVNPFGWWILLTYVLQGAMAARLVLATGTRSFIAASAAAVFTVCAAPFVHRIGHTALSSHFLILWALALYFENVRGSAPRLRELWVLAAVTLLVNSYLFAMVMVLHAATLVVLWRTGRFSRREGLITACGSALIVAIGLAAGYGVLLSHPTAARGGGFGLYSWNLTGLLIPHRAAIARDATGGQYEGDSYIGTGALLVLLVCLVAQRRKALQHVRHHRVLYGALALMAVYAASNRVYFGKTLVLAYYLPPAVEGLGNYFRATGRFIWPAAYALMVLPLASLCRSWKPYVTLPLVLVAVSLQVRNELHVFNDLRVVTARPQPDLIDSARMTSWMQAHARLWQYPSWACGGLGGSTRWWGNVEANRELQIELLAARRGMPTNSVYTSRVLKNCAVEATWALHPEIEQGVLYLLGREAIARAPALATLAASDKCVALEWGTVCSERFSTRARAY